MKVSEFGLYKDYSVFLNADGNSSFDYNQWNNNSEYNVSKFAKSLETEMATKNIGDLLSNGEISKIQVAAELPGAEVVGMEGDLSERRRLEQLQQAALQPRKRLGPFEPIRFEIPFVGVLKTYDSNGNPKIQKMYRVKIEWGYRLIDKKPNYHYNMHDLALDILNNAAMRMLHLGNLDRRWFNDKIYADDLQMELLSPYRWGADYAYRSLDLRDNGVKYRKGFATKALTAILGIPGGLLLGPRVSLVSTKPMTEERVRNLMAILNNQGPNEMARTMENN